MAELEFKIFGTGVGVSPSAIMFNSISIAQMLKKQTPTLEDEVTVEIIGQPGANKQQLYYLALATAFGIVRQYQIINSLLAFVTPSYGMLMSEDDAADNWVRCTIRYQVGMYATIVQTTLGKFFGVTTGFNNFSNSIFDQLTIYRGPQCNVNGGDFNFISTPINGVSPVGFSVAEGAIPGIPQDSNSGSAPKLPFRGQPIITPCPTTVTPLPQPVKENPAPDFPTFSVGELISSPNPKPPGDNRSRGSIPVEGVSTGTTQAPNIATLSNSGQSPGQSGNIPPQSGVSIGQPTTTDLKGKCCAINSAIIPLVFAALSAPATSSNMTFPNPTQGPTGR